MKLNSDYLPRLLVITVNAWSDKIASGNTISNHLGGWDKSKLSNLYLRNEEIDNECCEKYFKISEKDIVNSFFSKRDLGVEVQYTKEINSQSLSKILRTSKIKNFLIRIRPKVILLLRDLLWKVGFQSRNKLDNFLKKNAPEVIYIFCPSLIYGHRVLHYSHKITNAKVVVFFGDENYSYKNYWPLSVLYQFILRFWIRKTISISSINYAATPELCDYYSRISGKEFKVLYKGVAISPPVSKTYLKPLKIVYAGNLLYGRWQTLALISRAIEVVSSVENEFKLSIYTGTLLSKEMKISLNTNNSSVLGAVPFNEVKKIMDDADIVLHVEAFDKRNIQKTKYSFSTKITDCIQSGNCVMGIGPRELASINFLKESEGAIIANSYVDIISQLRKISLDNKIINNYRFKMYDFSKDLFDLDSIRASICKDFIELSN
ncbi:MAG: glycosyltransferase family protein [Lutibacter sp.]